MDSFRVFSLADVAQSWVQVLRVGRFIHPTYGEFEVTADDLRGLGRLDKYLVDPPREGAEALCVALGELAVEERRQRIAYVSCNPGSLARDAGILVENAGYQLKSAGIVNMFPHTAHVESIAVFER